MASTFGSVALAQEKAHVVTGRVVSIDASRNCEGIVVQTEKKRLNLITPTTIQFIGGTPKAGDTVKVYYTAEEFHARFDPDGDATKIEIIAAAGSNK